MVWMKERSHLPVKWPGVRRSAGQTLGFTLIEIMISIAVLAAGTMGGVSAFMLLNRYAANLRNMAEARALCQERIEQALTLHFVPTSSVVPAAPNSDPTTNAASNTPTFAILGAITNYNTTSGAFTGGNNLQTSLVSGASENIPVYTQSDGTSAMNSANVTYTRTTTVSPAGLVYATSGTGTTATSLNAVVFTVNVSYVFHGQTYSTFMTTMRSPD